MEPDDVVDEEALFFADFSGVTKIVCVSLFFGSIYIKQIIIIIFTVSLKIWFYYT